MKTLECEDCGRIATMADYIRHDNVKCAPCNGKMHLIAQTDGGANVPLDRLVMPEMAMIPMDKYLILKSDASMKGAFIKDMKRIAEENDPEWRKRVLDWLETLGA